MPRRQWTQMRTRAEVFAEVDMSWICSSGGQITSTSFNLLFGVWMTPTTLDVTSTQRGSTIQSVPAVANQTKAQAAKQSKAKSTPQAATGLGNLPRRKPSRRRDQLNLSIMQSLRITLRHAAHQGRRLRIRFRRKSGHKWFGNDQHESTDAAG